MAENPPLLDWIMLGLFALFLVSSFLIGWYVGMKQGSDEW